jgi:hypothetical protein
MSISVSESSESKWSLGPMATATRRRQPCSLTAASLNGRPMRRRRPAPLKERGLVAQIDDVKEES